MSQMMVYAKNKGSFSKYMQLVNTAATVSIAQSTKEISKGTEQLRGDVQRLGSDMQRLGSDMQHALGDVNRGIAELGAQFNYGMSMLASQMQAQQDQNMEIIYRLGNIEELLSNPDGTKAKEWVDKGVDYLSKNLLEEALDAFQRSSEVVKANFLTHYYIGKLYLFGADEDENIIDIDKAISSFGYAIKLGKGEIQKSGDITPLLVEVFFNHGVAYYVKGLESDEKDSSRELFEKAADSFETALQYQSSKKDASFGIAPFEIRYHLAKIMSLLENKEKAVEHLEYAIKEDKGYIDKAYADDDLSPVYADIPAIIFRQYKIEERINNTLKEAANWLDREVEKGSKFSEAAERLKRSLEIYPNIEIDLFLKIYPNIYEINQLVNKIEADIETLEFANRVWAGREELSNWLNKKDIKKILYYSEEAKSDPHIKKVIICKEDIGAASLEDIVWGFQKKNDQDSFLYNYTIPYKIVYEEEVYTEEEDVVVKKAGLFRPAKTEKRQVTKTRRKAKLVPAETPGKSDMKSVIHNGKGGVPEGFGPAGGNVFYDKGYYSDGWRFLEAAPESTEGVDKEWGGRNTYVGGTTTERGSGKENTEKIVNKLGRGDYAAKLCADLEYGGYDDWFLPSKDKLNKMYQNLKQRAIGGLASDYYWSSSEGSAGSAWGQDFRDGNQNDGSKSSNKRVRACRAF